MVGTGSGGAAFVDGFRMRALNVSSEMRDFAAAVAKRFVEAASAALKGAERLLEGAMPSPQPVPVPVRVRGRRDPRR